MRLQGKTYEDRAALFLEEAGLRILDRNKNYKVGEIDLVAEETAGRKITLVFVEVRMRTHGAGIRAEETLGPAKRLRLRRAISRYLAEYRGRASMVRMDLVAFDGDCLIHYPDFFGIIW